MYLEKMYNLLIKDTNRMGEEQLINTQDKACMGATKECYALSRANPGSNAVQNSGCMATYLPSYKQFKTNKTRWALLEKEGPTHKRRPPTDSHTSTRQSWPTIKNLNQCSADTDKV